MDTDQGMDLNELLRPEAVIANLKANSKKQALQELAERASEICGETERDIFDTLLQRERLGSTGVGNGIAIPHGKIVDLDGLHGLFARLDKPIEFDSLDDQPVDLIFVLLAPEGAGADHLKALARVARLLRDSDVASKLRATTDAAAIYSILTHPQASPNAA
jgi:PTS system nitrogen regulatory IIA component